MANLVHVLFDDYVDRAYRRERLFRDRQNPLDVYDDVELYERFRFRRYNLLAIIDELRDDLEYTSQRNRALSTELQTLITLRFLASGCFQNHVSDMIGVNRSTACRAIRRVCLALQRRMARYVYLPQDRDEIAGMKRDFATIANFPNVVACVDGTHVKIISPAANEWEYVNCKGYHSINVQLMCDAHLRIVNCVVRWPGSTHDSRILTESAVYNELQNRNDILVLGDSGYPLKQWLMVPFLRPQNDAEQAYNRAHMVTRSTIERCNGVLKRRFSCLHSELRLSPKRACSVIIASIILHNKAIMFGDIDNVEMHEDQQIRVDNNQNNLQNDLTGRIARLQLVNLHFT